MSYEGQPVADWLPFFGLFSSELSIKRFFLAHIGIYFTKLNISVEHYMLQSVSKTKASLSMV
ncbi:hypothetical protein BK411_10900 [Vibrio splendidus]|nr:hypothetical protein BK411_10900 [Vibrio splendidus]